MDPLPPGLEQILAAQKTDLLADPYPNLAIRLDRLERLKRGVKKYEQLLLDTARQDFQKPAFETFATEIALICQEIRHFQKQLKRWLKPKRRFAPWYLLPSRTWSQCYPKGQVLIISPWNYPIQLALLPAIGALAAGNRIVLKPSELTPQTSSLLAQLVREQFSTNEFALMQGDAILSQQLLEKSWDLVFFTGSTAVGQKVYQAAAKTLSPVILELGGKSPAIIFSDANIHLTARRLIWAKLVNAGQTCVAPDLVFVHKSLLTPLLEALREEVRRQTGEEPVSKVETAVMISLRHKQRMDQLIEDSKEHIYYQSSLGGDHPRGVPATILLNPGPHKKVMQEEIFGPLLPVVSFDSEAELLDQVRRFCPDSLAAYFFGSQKKNMTMLANKLRFGGGCFNDALVHLGSVDMPFGGIGFSGMGAYHGKQSFLAFSHQRTMLSSSLFVDVPLRYQPYSLFKLNLLRKWLG
jgi:aldehyde dehydrogenase (NAD+)